MEYMHNFGGVGRINSIQGGGGQKGEGRDIFKIQGELKIQGEFKNSGGFGRLPHVPDQH